MHKQCELYEDFKQLKHRKENRTRFVVVVKRNNPHIWTLKYSFQSYISVRNMADLNKVEDPSHPG